MARSAVLLAGAIVLLAAQAAVAAKFDWTNAQYIDALKSIDFEPYTLERHQQIPYNPRTKPWDKVIAAFYTLLSYERRYAAFLIRGSFHDCLAVNTTTCTNPRKPGPGCRGCEGSMMLQDEELGRIENSIKKWGARLSKPLRIICKAFDISMADALAVGAAVAPTFLTHGRVQIVGKGLKVGRLDYLETAPARTLAAPGITTEQFIDFWQKADFSVKEGVALLGSHALLDNNFCQRGLRDFDVCNPEIECCEDIKGMRWENHYYHDMCSGGLIITPVNPPVPVYPPKNVTLMTDEEFKAIVKTETCGFTSSDFKDSVRNLMGLVRAGSQQMEEFPASTLINWSQNGCTRSRRYGVRRDECPHPSNWPYTLNDAFNGQVCAEDNDRRKEGRDVKEIRRALREYTDQDEWDRDYTRAYIKMTEAWAHMPNAWTLPSIDPPVGTPSNPDFGLPVKLAEQLKSLEAADA